MPKSIFTTLNGKKVAIEASENGGFSDAKILPAYSKYCYETNACCACKDDKTGMTCLNNTERDVLNNLNLVENKTEDDGSICYKSKGLGTKYVLVGYSCNDNKYTMISYYKSEERALEDISNIETSYGYDYYCMYKDSEMETKVYRTSFWVYTYQRLIASKCCSYKNMPIPLNTMLIGQFLDDNILGGRWVLFK